MSEPTYFQNPQSCAYIAEHGIDPNRMALDGWNAEGYETYQGEGKYGDSSHPRLRLPWPDGFDYQTFLALWAADEPSRRSRVPDYG